MANSVFVRPPRTMLEVFQSLPEGTLVQLINNQIIISPAPTTPHQKVLGKIYSQLLQLVEEKQMGEVILAPVDVYFNSKNVFQPDIIFISSENMAKIEEDGFHGAPDMVIEILSPSTWHFDYGEKKDLYERFGVKEYWLINPADKKAEGFTLVNKEFVSMGTSEGKIRFKLINGNVKF